MTGNERSEMKFGATASATGPSDVLFEEEVSGRVACSTCPSHPWKDCASKRSASSITLIRGISKELDN